MGFGNKSILITRYADKQNVFTDLEDDKILELGDEVSDQIYQITSVAVPTDPASAPPILRGIWCDIVLFKLVPYQKGIAEEEKQRRRGMMNDAIDLLEKISTGEIILKDSEGTAINTGTAPISIVGTKRITGVV